jgi:hypothetical protein
MNLPSDLKNFRPSEDDAALSLSAAAFIVALLVLACLELA